MKLFSKWLLAAACGMAVWGFATGASAADLDCGMNTGKPATGAPIPIGAITTASGAADMSHAVKGAKAYFDCVNANGGINGRPIEYSIDDDQTRPDKAAEIAKKLVEDRKVVALVGGASLVDCIATAKYYEDSNIISLMSAGVAPQCFNARNIAAMNAGPRYGLINAVTYGVKELGVKHIACPQPTIPGADWICDGIKAYAELAGIKSSTFTFDQQSADNDSLIQQIVQTGADATIYLGSPPTIVPFLAAAERADAGDKIKFLAPAPVYNPRIPEALGPYWNDRLWVNLEWSALDTGGKDANNFLAVMKDYGAVPDAFAQGGYLAARVAVHAMLTIDADKIDRDSVTAALQSVQNYQSDMLCDAWSFGEKDATARLGNRAGWMAKMHENGWQVLSGCVSVDPAVIK